MKGGNYSGCLLVKAYKNQVLVLVRSELKGLVKSSCLQCTQHMEEVFPGVQCFHVWLTNFIHRCHLRRTSALRSLSEGI